MSYPHYPQFVPQWKKWAKPLVNSEKIGSHLNKNVLYYSCTKKEMLKGVFSDGKNKIERFTEWIHNGEQ